MTQDTQQEPPTRPRTRTPGPISLADAALAYAELGFAIHPLIPKTKRPLLKGWLSKATSDRATVLKWWRENPDANIGCVPGASQPALVALDIDGRNGGPDHWKALKLPVSPLGVRSGSGDGWHLWYRAPGPMGNTVVAPGIELHYLSNMVLPPSVHPNGGTYLWAKDPPAGPLCDLLPLPEELHELAERTPTILPTPESPAGSASTVALLEEAEDTANLLRRLPPGWCDDRTLWMRVAMATKLKWLELGHESLGFTLWDTWSKGSPAYDRAQNLDQWKSLRPVENPVTWGSIIVEAGLSSRQPADETHTERQILWASDALQEPEPMTWQVEGLFTEGSVVVFAGEAGSKKSYSAMTLAACLALGKPWLQFPTRPCTVLFVDEESGLSRLHRRLREVLFGLNATASTPLAFVTLWGFQLMKPAGLEQLEAVIAETGARFVVLDSFIDFMGGGDENSATDMQLVLHGLRAIANRTGASFLILHHFRKDGGYRGSTALPAAADLMVEVESPSGESVVTFTSTKTRDIEAIKFGAIATWTQTGAGDPLFTLEPAQAVNVVDDTPTDHASRSTIMGIVLETPGCSQAFVFKEAKAAEISEWQARRTLDRLVKEGAIIATKSRKGLQLIAIPDRFPDDTRRPSGGDS